MGHLKFQTIFFSKLISNNWTGSWFWGYYSQKTPICYFIVFALWETLRAWEKSPTDITLQVWGMSSLLRLFMNGKLSGKTECELE